MASGLLSPYRRRPDPLAPGGGVGGSGDQFVERTTKFSVSCRIRFPESLRVFGNDGRRVVQLGRHEHPQKCAIVSRRAFFRQHNLVMLLVARERVARWLADWALTRLLSTLSTLSSGRGPRPSHKCLSIGQISNPLNL